MNFARPEPVFAAPPCLYVRSQEETTKRSVYQVYTYISERSFLLRGSSYIIHLFSRQPAKMAARPTVTVYAASGEASGSLALPSVFTAPIRLDVVQQVHSELKICTRGQLRGERGTREGLLQGGSTLAMESVEMRTMAAEMEGIKVGRENQGGVVDQARRNTRSKQAYNRDSEAKVVDQ